MIFRLALVALTALLLAGSNATPAAADDVPDIPWVGDNPYGFGLGDSVLQSCGEKLGMDWRSLGFIGWPGADTAAMRARLDGTGSGWPDWTVTESSTDEEKVWFRDAGFLVIALGTNDVKTMTADQFRTQVDWFLEQSKGRPVLWFNIVNPPFQETVNAFNAVLDDAADRWPNLKILDWERWVQQNPGNLHDGVHVSWPSACIEGRDRLIQFAAPRLPWDNSPRGYWYEHPAGTGEFALNGWGATNIPGLHGPLEINVRADYRHVGRWPVENGTDDLWAQTASGRGFGVGMGPEWRGRWLCLDLVDAAGQFTSLGCRTV